MKRAAVLMILLAVVGAGPALAQTSTTSTTSTSTSTTSTSTSTTSTTVPSTTTTTAPSTVDADPPAAFLSGASGEVRGELGSYCWSQPGGTTGRCVDKIAPPTGPTLSVRKGETLSLRFATGLPLTQLEVRRDGAVVAVPVANPARFVADLAPGTYQLLVSPRFSAGSAVYGFRLRVTAPPAKPTPAPRVGLTG